MSSGQRWTDEQEKLLHKAHEDYGSCWRLIADEFRGKRSAKACEAKWRAIEQEKKKKEKERLGGEKVSKAGKKLTERNGKGSGGGGKKSGKATSKDVDGGRPASTKDQAPNRRSPSLRSASVKIDEASTTSHGHHRTSESSRPLFPKRTQRSVSPSDSVRRSSSPTPTVNAAPRYRSTTPSSRSPSPQLHPRKYSLHKYSSKRKAAALDCDDEDEEELFAEVEQQSRKKRKIEMTDRELDDRCIKLLERVVGVVEKIQARRGA